MRASLHHPVSRRLALLIGFAGLSTIASLAAAQEYPGGKPVTIVVGFAAGGAADQLARLFGQKMSETFKTPFVVENRLGAAATIAAAKVAQSAPDGHTLLLGTTATQSIAPSIYKALAYDPAKDFQPISLLAEIPLAFVVNPKVKATTPAELIAVAKAAPQTPLSFASAGTGGVPHLTGELFQVASRIKMTHVPYKGGAAAMGDLVTGRVDAMFDHLPSVLPFIKSGQLRAIGVVGARRARSLPDLPTLSEAGISGLDVSSWFGLLAPAGTPPQVVAKLHAEIARLMKTDEIKTRLEAIGAEPVGSSPTEFARTIAEDTRIWGDIVRKTNATVD